QMCRWFGYRPKYEDLCRVYLTQDNVDRFDIALDAIEDFKMQLEDMKLNDKTPKDYGLMIKQSPETLETTLLITSRNKLRGTEEIQLRLNYGGVYADTSKLPRRADVNKYNLKKFQQFSKKLKNRFGWKDNFYMASGIEKFAIADLIKELKISYVNKKFDTKTLSEYIEKSEMFELWDVVIETGDKKAKDSMKYDFEGEKLVCVHRSFSINNKEDEFIRLGGTNNRVIDPGVFNAGLWLSEAASQAILEEKKRNDPKHGEYKTLSATDYLKKRERPILVIYPIELKTECNDKEKEDWGDLIDDLRIIKDNIKKQLSNGENEPLLAFGIGFPKKENPVAVSYRANQIKLAQLRAGIEPDYDDVDGDINDD
ncbi:MAG: Z1 domain-containing protein, partial [Cyanobacteriota bacterium]|nr:Z1 domain-containing protein [Cyanobacteriota bacterium]